MGGRYQQAGENRCAASPIETAAQGVGRVDHAGLLRDDADNALEAMLATDLVWTMVCAPRITTDGPHGCLLTEQMPSLLAKVSAPAVAASLVELAGQPTVTSSIVGIKQATVRKWASRQPFPDQEQACPGRRFRDHPLRSGSEAPAASTPGSVVPYRWHVVELVPITRDNWRRAAAVRAANGQLRFVADYEPVALVILSKAFVRVADLDWWPHLIEDAGRAVGVVALVDERQMSGGLALFHLLIDADQQRRGYGRAAVRRVVQFARDLEDCNRVRLTVHPENRVAIDLYQSEGFIVDGVEADGELCLSTATPPEQHRLS
jgi:diamine N-acetyltransferase